MTFLASRRFSILLLVLAALPLSAENKRHSAAPAIPLVTVHGTVTDVTTGAPVAFADVNDSPRSTKTDAQGKFDLDVPLGVPTVIQVGRSGYESASSSVIGRNALTVEFKLKSKPTVTMKLTNGTTYNLDSETAQFAEEIVFSNPVRSDGVLVCNADASQTTINKTDIAKILGPGVAASNASCCKTPLTKVTLAMKNGTSQDVLLQQTCDGSFMDFSGRDHTTGLFVYTRFQDIQEIDFP